MTSEVKQQARDYWNDRSQLFSSYYEEPSAFDKVFRRGIYTRVAVALETCQQLDAPSVLDIGSGPGINSVTLLKNSDAKHLTGIDFAPNMVEHARRVVAREGVSDRCDFIEGDFLKHDFQGRTFDLSVALGVLDYVEDAAAFVKKACEVSTRRLVISWPENGLRMMLRRYRYDCPVFHYSESDIRGLHEMAGVQKLELIKYEGGWASVATP